MQKSERGAAEFGRGPERAAVNPQYQSTSDLAARVQALEEAQEAQTERVSRRSHPSVHPGAAVQLCLAALRQWPSDLSDRRWPFHHVHPHPLPERLRALSRRTSSRPASGVRAICRAAPHSRAYSASRARPIATSPTNSASTSGSSGVEGTELSKAVVHYVGIPNWHFSMGMIEPAFMFEGATSSGNLMFLERSGNRRISAPMFIRRRSSARRGVEVGPAGPRPILSGPAIMSTPPSISRAASLTARLATAMAAMNRSSCWAVSPTASGPAV